MKIRKKPNEVLKKHGKTLFETIIHPPTNEGKGGRNDLGWVEFRRKPKNIVFKGEDARAPRAGDKPLNEVRLSLDDEETPGACYELEDAVNGLVRAVNLILSERTK